MIKFDVSVDIDKPIEDVFEYLVDPDVLPEWQSGVIETRKTTEGPMGVGTQMIDVRRVLGKKLDSEVEVTRYEPHHDFDIQTLSGPVEFSVEQHLEKVDGKTRLSVHVEGEPGGFFKFAESIVKKNTERQFVTDFNTLKDILEHR